MAWYFDNNIILPASFAVDHKIDDRGKLINLFFAGCRSQKW